MGPSGPTGIPLPTAQQQDRNLTTIVLMLKMCRTTVPLRKPISSGIPEPPALGLTNWAEGKKVVLMSLLVTTYTCHIKSRNQEKTNIWTKNKNFISNCRFSIYIWGEILKQIVFLPFECLDVHAIIL